VKEVREEKVKLGRIGFVKQIGFKLGVKERERKRGGYACAEW